MPILLAALLLLAAVVPAHGAPCVVNSNCTDGDLCNGVERCVAGVCQPGQPLECDDGDPCTRDFCDPTAGCAHAEDQCPASCAALPDDARCADGTVCTRDDRCSAGVCVPGPAVDCTDGDP